MTMPVNDYQCNNCGQDTGLLNFCIECDWDGTGLNYGDAVTTAAEIAAGDNRALDENHDQGGQQHTQRQLLSPEARNNNPALSPAWPAFPAYVPVPNYNQVMVPFYQPQGVFGHFFLANGWGYSFLPLAALNHQLYHNQPLPQIPLVAAADASLAHDLNRRLLEQQVHVTNNFQNDNVLVNRNNNNQIQPDRDNVNNHDAAATPSHSAAKPLGVRGRRNARLVAQGRCIWCCGPNPDKRKKGCPACLPKRAAMTAKWRRKRRDGGEEGKGRGEGGEVAL